MCKTISGCGVSEWMQLHVETDVCLAEMVGSLDCVDSVKVWLSV